ncbi:MAG: hypothetical protein WCK01_04900 [Candidatus Uhrbacteria bacterium]
MPKYEFRGAAAPNPEREARIEKMRIIVELWRGALESVLKDVMEVEAALGRRLEVDDRRIIPAHLCGMYLMEAEEILAAELNGTEVEDSDNTNRLSDEKWVN